MTYDPNLFVFKEEDHTYHYDGELVPGVNGVMEAVGVQDFSMMPTHDRDRYLTRGEYVHYAMKLLQTDGLDWDTIDESILGYCRAGEKFLKDTGYKAICVEKPLYHPIYRYAGTPDSVGTFSNGRTVLPDWKTGAVGRPVRWQTGGYGELFMVNDIAIPTERYGVELKENGKYKMTEAWIDDRDRTDFLGFVGTYYNQKLRIKDGKVERV